MESWFWLAYNIAALFPSIVTDTSLKVVVAKPVVMVRGAGVAGPILLPKIVTISPGLSDPLAKLPAFTIPKMEAAFPTVTGIVAEFPPGAGLATKMFNVVDAVSRVAGTTACNRVELSLNVVVVKGVATPCTMATEAA